MGIAMEIGRPIIDEFPSLPMWGKFPTCRCDERNLRDT
jgi:hypothetical protein